MVESSVPADAKSSTNGWAADIVEVVEAGLFRANLYLGAGYRLLSANVTTQPRKMPDGKLFVRRGFTYLLGRTADVERFEPPAWKPNPPTEAEA